jgi:hypothetical protein
MPFYRFQIDVDAPPQVVAERLKSIVRDKPTFRESLRRVWPFGIPVTAPFIGSVDGASFKLQRDIRYRNSFLPMIRGRIMPNGIGTQVSVTMFLHPLVAIFMIFWLSTVALAAVPTRSASSMIPLIMFVVGVAMPVGGFIPEAIKAQQLIRDAIADSPFAASQGTAAYR